VYWAFAGDRESEHVLMTVSTVLGPMLAASQTGRQDELSGVNHGFTPVG
jgi:hypothetical protein